MRPSPVSSRVGSRNVDRLQFFLELREPEVEDFHASVARQHHVGRLQVAVRDAALVRRADGVGERNRDGQDLRERQTLRGQQIGQRAAVDQFQRQEGDAVGFFDRVDRDDVGVIERGRCAGFALKRSRRSASPASSGLRILSATGRSEPGVLGYVDLAHPALA